MTDIQAAIGLVQTREAGSLHRAAHRQCRLPDERLQGWVKTPVIRPGHRHVYHQYTIRVPTATAMPGRRRWPSAASAPPSTIPGPSTSSRTTRSKASMSRSPGRSGGQQVLCSAGASRAQPAGSGDCHAGGDGAMPAQGRRDRRGSMGTNHLRVLRDFAEDTCNWLAWPKPRAALHAP